MFEFLFKYPWETFERGTLLLALPSWQLMIALFAIIILAFFLLGYFSVTGRTRFIDRGVISLFRGTAIFLILFSLLKPMLEVPIEIPQRNVVGVLIDNSVSMGIKDFDGQTRSQFVVDQFNSKDGSLLHSLQEKFDTRLFRFGKNTELVNDIEVLDFNDGASDLTQALQMVQETLKGEPLAGLLIVSDGAIKSTANLSSALLSLRASGIPVHTIGVGQAQYERDIEVTRIKLPKKVLKGSRVIADVSINHRGYSGQSVELVVEDDSRILHKETIRLKSGTQTLKVPFSASEVGSRQIQFHIAAKPDEQIPQNNSNNRMISVDDSKVRILYFEGEPRFELKFLRRSIEDDKNLKVTGLVRTADAKYYRVGVDSSEELRDGFPTTQDELFSYDALILGSVETTLLSPEQQDLIASFVSSRGGGLLMLGGHNSFAEGGYRTTVLQDIAPVIMNKVAQRDFLREVKIQPTAAGWVHPTLLIDDTNEKSMARWLTLPPLTIVNPIQEIKPGATMLLTSTAEKNNQYVALAFHRYGRGKVAALPVQNLWLWQMHHEIDIEDQTHEILWRQLLRWLVDSVPTRLSLSLSSELIHSNGTIRLRSEALERTYDSHNQAKIQAVLTAPTGVTQIKLLSRDPTKQGVYEAEVAVADPGDYLVHLEMEDQDKVVRSDESRFRVAIAGGEYYQSEMNEKLLRRISDNSNGRFFNTGNASRMVEVMSQQQRGSSVLVRYELWDIPILFLLLVLTLCGEWGYRRWRNLA